MTDDSAPRGSIDPHPGPDTLAEHAEGLLAPAAAGRVADHLDGCEECRADLARLDAVSATLAAEPEPGPLPVEIAARIEAALTAAGRPTPLGAATADLAGTDLAGTNLAGTERAGTDLATARRRRGWPRVLLAAAAAGVVALGGWAALSGQVTPDVVAGGGGTDTAASTEAEPGDDSVPDESAARAEAQSPPGAAGGGEQLAGEPGLTDLAIKDELGRLIDEALALDARTADETTAGAKAACGQPLAAALDRSVLAAGSTLAADRAAVLVVLAVPGTLDRQVWVLPDCAAGPADALAVLPLPAR